MEHPRSFYLIVLSLIGSVGLALKVATIAPTVTADASDLAYAEVDRRLQPHGFSLVDVRQVTTDGNFQMRLYKADYCPRPVLMLPLKRNAEGALILRSRLGDGWREPQFVLAGNTYSVFPPLELWWHQLVNALKVWDKERRQPIVWAVAESTACAGTQPFHKLLS